MSIPSSLLCYNEIERMTHLNYTRTEYMRLDANEKPYPLPQKIIDTIFKEITPDKISAYPEIYTLYNTVSKKFNIPEKNLLFTNGSDAAIKYIFQTYVDKKDKVLSVPPTFGMIPVYAKLFQANHIEIKYDNDLNLDVNSLTEVIEGQDIKLFYLSNPNSPTGTILNDGEMDQLLKITCKNDTVFLLDEAYIPFYKTSYIHAFKKYRNLVIIRTFSKFFGIPSVRLGFIVSDKTNIDNIFKMIPTYEVNTFAILFGEKIFDFENVLNNYLEEVEKAKRRVIDFCEDNELNYISTSTNFMFINLGKKTANLIGKWLKTEKKILVRYSFVHPALEHCIRFSLGNERQMDYLLSSIKEFLEKNKFKME